VDSAKSLKGVNASDDLNTRMGGGQLGGSLNSPATDLASGGTIAAPVAVTQARLPYRHPLRLLGIVSRNCKTHQSGRILPMRPDA